jgi:hypothetical protein
MRDRLIVETAGNPLAVIELCSTLSPDQLSGAEPVLAPIPVSARVEGAFLERVRRLPKETQTLLLVAATDDSGELATVLRAAGELGATAEALDAAEEAGLAQVRAGRLELRHPLVRSAVYQSAPLSKRQAATARSRVCSMETSRPIDAPGIALPRASRPTRAWSTNSSARPSEREAGAPSPPLRLRLNAQPP